MAEPPSSPPSESASAEDAVTWYKLQYELLEAELGEFRESSRELEQELEKDIERAEKQERLLQEKAEGLSFEVEEWKRKYRESKTEASAAQSLLEKEITTLRNTTRTLHLRLRDSEVANDDFERQARNTTSSLEDLESKLNQAIERAVLMEEEIKMGEQEREQLRIDAQRVREQMAELRIEGDLMKSKIKKQEERHMSTMSSDLSILGSPTFDKNVDDSPDSTASSPLITTPPGSKCLPEPPLQMLDPPSPPMSDASATLPRSLTCRTPVPTSGTLRKYRLPSVDISVTPKPRGLKHPAASTRVPGARALTAGSVPTTHTPAHQSGKPRAASHKIPASNSLSHIRNLTAQMQRLEARVHSVRSKLPAPTHTPPQPSPRNMMNSTPFVPSTVTIRSRKRGAGSTTSSSVGGDDTTPTNYPSTSSKPSHMPRLSTSGVSRLSFGTLPNRGPDSEIPRPSSRASVSSYARPPSRTDVIPRPMSRTSFSSSRTPMARPRSSLSGSLHSHSASIGASLSGMDLEEEEDYENDFRTPSRRGTYSKLDLDGGVSCMPIPETRIPTPGPRRQSGGGRRTSTGGVSIHSGRTSTTGMRRLGDLGETY